MESSPEQERSGREEESDNIKISMIPEENNESEDRLHVFGSNKNGDTRKKTNLEIH